MKICPDAEERRESRFARVTSTCFRQRGFYIPWSFLSLERGMSRKRSRSPLTLPRQRNPIWTRPIERRYRSTL